MFANYMILVADAGALSIMYGIWLFAWDKRNRSVPWLLGLGLAAFAIGSQLAP